MGISSRIRLKRYRVKRDADLRLMIEFTSGEQKSFQIDGLSVHGLSVVNVGDDIGLNDGDLAASSKIIGSEIDISLGRIVLRHKEEESHFGFSCVDARIPIDGILSKHIDAIEVNPHETELDPNKFTLREFLAEQSYNKDILAKCRDFGIMLREWEKSPQFQYKTVRDHSKGSRIKITSHKKPVVIMGSNDYLGMAHHPKVMEAAKNAIDVYGLGSTGSPLTTGLTVLHEELADYMASFLKKEKVILFNSGYAANLGSLQSLAKANDLIIADFLSHSSIQDGMRLSSASSRFYKHNSTDHLESILKEKRGDYAGCVIVTEGVFSMHGNKSKLEEIVEIANRYDARVYLDEAHSLGVIGDRGEGAAASQKLSKKVDVLMGTFSKSFGNIGGFIAGDRDVCDWLYLFARSHMFSVSLGPSTVAGVLEAAKIIRREPEIVQQLQRNIKYFVAGLRELGINLPHDHDSAIVPLVIGDEKKMGRINEYLISNGVFVVPIVFPAVAKKDCRFRFTLMASHTESELDFVLHVLKNALDLGGYQA